MRQLPRLLYASPYLLSRQQLRGRAGHFVATFCSPGHPRRRYGVLGARLSELVEGHVSIPKAVVLDSDGRVESEGGAVAGHSCAGVPLGLEEDAEVGEAVGVEEEGAAAHAGTHRGRCAGQVWWGQVRRDGRKQEGWGPGTSSALLAVGLVSDCVGGYANDAW